jgi:hypothetical protein
MRLSEKAASFLFESVPSFYRVQPGATYKE